MADAALILGIIGTSTGVIGLGWNGLTYYWGRPHIEVKLVYGAVMGGHGVISDYREHPLPVVVRELKLSLERGAGRITAGINIVNVGRSTFHVAALHFQAVPGPLSGHNAWMGFEGPPTIPEDIPPGGQRTYFVDLAQLKGQHRIAEGMHGTSQQMVLEVWSGKKKFRTPPIPSELLDLAPEPFGPGRLG